MTGDSTATGSTTRNPSATTAERSENRAGESARTRDGDRRPVPRELSEQFRNLREGGEGQSSIASESALSSPSTKLPGSSTQASLPLGFGMGEPVSGLTSGAPVANAETIGVADLAEQFSGSVASEIMPSGNGPAAMSSVTAASGAAQQAPAPSLSDLLERRVRRLLMDEQAGKADEGGRLMMTLDDGPLGGTEIWLERSASGWRVEARAGDEDTGRLLDESADDLRDRFNAAGLGDLELSIDTRGRKTL